MTIFPLGVYVGNPNGNSSAAEMQFESDYNHFSTAMGVQPKFLDLYVDQMKPIGEWVDNAGWQAWSASLSPIARLLTPVIGFPMASGAPGSPTADQFYKDFAAGRYDSVIQGVVQKYAQMGFMVQYLRPGWEFNLNIQPHYAGDDATTQTDWVKAFQHIATVMHTAGLTYGVDVKVVWNPSVTNYTNAKATIDLYPGDRYVDVIAADAYSDLYPYSDSTDGLIYDWDRSGQVLNSPHPVFSTLQQWASSSVNLAHYYQYPASGRWALDQSGGHALSLNDLIEFTKAHGKTFAVAETGAGATSDGAGVADNAVFVKWLSQTLIHSAVPVAFVNVWDSNAGANYAFSGTQNDKPNEAAAWKTYFGAGSQPDTTPPVLTIGQSVSGATNMRSVTLSGVVSDGQSGLSNVEVFDFTGGRKVDLGAAMIDATGHWTYTAASLTNGGHQFSATAKDIAGNVTAPVPAGTLITVDTIAPQPVIRTITGNRDGGVTLSGMSEANSMVMVTDTVDSKTISLGSVTTSGSGSWLLTSHMAVKTASVNRYAASSIDAAGNIGNTTGTFYLSSTGFDTLTGSPNVIDVFSIMSFRGADIINNFQTTSAAGGEHDVINFSGRGITSFEQVKQYLSGVDSAVITIGSGKTVTLTGVSPSSLTGSDFVYS